jgi:hypothetical protein
LPRSKKLEPRSLYGDGSFERKLPVVNTVGELADVLAKLPRDLPLNGDEGYKLRWMNVGHAGAGGNQEHLDLDDFDFEDW